MNQLNTYIGVVFTSQNSQNTERFVSSLSNTDGIRIMKGVMIFPAIPW